MASAPPSVLRYYANREVLSGCVGNQHFHMKAYSGGGRGSLHPEKWEHTLMSRLATTKETSHQRGGTLPPGVYLCEYMAHHPKFHECVRLHKTASSAAISSPFATQPIAHGRDLFYIHGRGEAGSDGCIVPEEPAKRLALTHAIKNHHGLVTVEVVGSSYMLPAERGSGFVA